MPALLNASVVRSQVGKRSEGSLRECSLPCAWFVYCLILLLKRVWLVFRSKDVR